MRTANNTYRIKQQCRRDAFVDAYQDDENDFALVIRQMSARDSQMWILRSVND